MNSLIESKYANEAIPDELIPENVSPSVYRVLSNPNGEVVYIGLQDR